MKIAAYVYPGFHPIPERDAGFYPGFTEWDLVASCTPRFPGHAQPRVPLLGPYDDERPRVVKLAVREMPSSGKPDELLAAAGIDAAHIAEAARRLLKT